MATRNIPLPVSAPHPALAGAVITALSLVGGVLLGIVVGNLVFNLMPGHSLTNPSPVAVAVAAIPALAGSIGLGLRNRPLAWHLLWQVGLVAVLAFLVVNLLMESSGWVVGAPRAAERFTLLTVMSVSNFGAALAGGAVMGDKLSDFTSQRGRIISA